MPVLDSPVSCELGTDAGTGAIVGLGTGSPVVVWRESSVPIQYEPPFWVVALRKSLSSSIDENVFMEAV